MKKIFITGLLLSSFALSAQNQKVLSRKETQEMVVQLLAVFKQTYYDDKKMERIDAVLRDKLRSGAFYNNNPQVLTEKLTNILREETHDIHFYVGNNQKAPDTVVAYSEKEFLNGGFTEVRLLKNNIGYIKWIRCIADEHSFQKILDAFNFLGGCDKLIIDISENPGGDGASGGFINQYLYADGAYKDLLLKRCTGEKEWRRSEAVYDYSTGVHFFNVPLYVIVSENTASAAEYFAFTAQEMKRGKILGKTTAGAGNPVVAVPFGDYFAYIPVCEITTTEGKSIEGKGVSPDIVLKTNDWLEEALGYIMSHQ